MIQGHFFLNKAIPALLVGLAFFLAGCQPKTPAPVKVEPVQTDAFHMAEEYRQAGDLEKALVYYRQYVGTHPKDKRTPLALKRMADIYLERDEKPKAIDVLKECAAEESANPENFNYLGMAYYRSGNFDLALKNYRKALELDHNYAAVFNNIGSLYLSIFLKNKDRQAHAQAMRNFDKAIEIDPLLFSAYNGRGAAHVYGNKIEQALSDWQKAIEIKPDYTDPYFSMGIVYLRIGDKARALQIFLALKEKNYSKLSPHDRERLERLISQAK